MISELKPNDASQTKRGDFIKVPNTLMIQIIHLNFDSQLTEGGLMKRITFIIICCVLLSGCATTNMLKPEKPPELAATSDSALLVIIRDTWMGGLVAFQNYLDGEFIGETTGNTYFVTQVPPGEHYIVSKTENTGVANLNFETGKHYYLRQGVTVGWMRARTSGFFPMTSEEAKKAIQGCEYLQLDTSKSVPDMDPALYQKAVDEYNAGVKDDPEGYKELLEYKGERLE